VTSEGAAGVSFRYRHFCPSDQDPASLSFALPGSRVRVVRMSRSGSVSMLLVLTSAAGVAACPDPVVLDISGTRSLMSASGRIVP
jgi:hypothetical protein